MMVPMDELGFGLWATAVGMGTVLAILVALMLMLMGLGWLDQRPARRAAARAVNQALTDEELALVTRALDAHTQGGTPALPSPAPVTPPAAPAPSAWPRRGWGRHRNGPT
jgi:Na+-transporting methylmalonyl-CoA/oxaloacetate decarboxylase gamma subunit